MYTYRDLEDAINQLLSADDAIQRRHLDRALADNEVPPLILRVSPGPTGVAPSPPA